MMYRSDPEVSIITRVLSTDSNGIFPFDFGLLQKQTFFLWQTNLYNTYRFGSADNFLFKISEAQMKSIEVKANVRL